MQTADIRGQWCVFNKTREFRRDQRAQSGGIFEIDPNVRAILKSEAGNLPPMDYTQPLLAAPLPLPSTSTRAHAPTAFAAANASPPPVAPRATLPQPSNQRAARPQLHTERRSGFERLLEAHQRTTKAVALLCAFAEALSTDIAESTAEVLFEDMEDFHMACKQMLAILEDLIRRDPELKSNIGAGLRHAANLIEGPLVPISNRLKRAIEAAQRLSPHLDRRLAQTSAAHNSDHTLVSLLRSIPSLMSYYPSFVKHLLDVTPANYPDHGTLQEAQSIFEELNERLAPTEEGGLTATHNAVLDGNPLAELPGISIHDLPVSAPPGEHTENIERMPRERLGTGAFQDGGRLSPYAMMTEAGSRRMSLAPDAEEDEDQLPIADQRTPPANLQRPQPQMAAAGGATQNGTPTAQAQAQQQPPPPLQQQQQRSVSPPAQALDEPSWMHGDLSKSGADELIKEGVPLNGRFLVRNRTGQPGEYVLTLTYKQQATHHLIGRDEDNFITINRRRYGGNHTSLVDALRVLVQPVAQWPQQLVDFVPRAGADLEAVQADRQALGLAV